MKTEKDKMLAGELYDPLDPELEAGRRKARELCRRLNASGEDEKAERRALLDDLFGAATDVWLQPPFYCDYGTQHRRWAARSSSTSIASCSTWRR